MTRHIVAITGKRGHGKTTAAAALERLGYRHINFADPVRAVVERVYGVTPHEMADPVLKEQVLDRWPFKSPRELMQVVGTDMFRKTEFSNGEALDETWVEAFKVACAGYSHVVCSDLRFPNEAIAIKAMGGLILKVENPRISRTDVASQHASETAIDKLKADWTIYNEGSIQQLQSTVLDFAEDHRLQHGFGAPAPLAVAA